MSEIVKRVLLTGADGFIGRNLALRLAEFGRFDVVPVTRETERYPVENIDAVVHLAGVNRPADPSGFAGNHDVTRQLVDVLTAAGKAVPLLVTSSVKASEPTPYGDSKRAAEDIVRAYGDRCGVAATIWRLPNIFGKWCRPNYNSAVATFCHNIARDLPIVVDDPATPLDLLYIDDLVAAIVAWLDAGSADAPGPVYATTVGNVADCLRRFRANRADGFVEPVGAGLTRALYATYVSYLPTGEFAYPLVSHGDARGVFSEMLKTRDSGQFSYFTAHPGVTRGGHYHHTKTEKFLVVQGRARFQFRQMITGETHRIDTDGDTPVVVETVPGWTHDITNTGDGPLIALLWANEIFDPDRPDTIAEKV